MMIRTFDYICAQPDKLRFRWELKVLLGSLLKLGVQRDNIHFLVLLEDRDEPSPEMRRLEQYAKIYYYKERPEFVSGQVDRVYKPSSKPYLFYRFWQDHPEYVDKAFFFVESDMLVLKVPDIEAVSGVRFWSDASKAIEPGLLDGHFKKTPVGTPFGFHCIGSGFTADFWAKVEWDSNVIFHEMVQKNLPGNRWIAEMRAWMWNSNEQEGITNVIHPELQFMTGEGLKKSFNLYHQLGRQGFRKKEFVEQEPFDWADQQKVAAPFQLGLYIQAIKDARTIIGTEKNVSLP